MNYRKNLILGLATFVSAAMMIGCSNPIAQMVKLAQEQSLEVNPNPLELHGDQVPFTMSAKLPIDMMKKGTKYTLEVAYIPSDDFDTMQPDALAGGEDGNEFASSAQTIGAIPFDGDKYQGQTEDPKVSKEFNFAYEDKYENGGLIVRGIATKIKNNKSKFFGPVKLVVADGGLVKGVATTSRLVKSPVDGVNPTTSESPFAYADPNYTGPVDEYADVNIYFEQSSARVLPTTASNRETMEMVAELYEDTKVAPFEASGTSSHSPEGRESVNTQLADDRASSLEQNFKGMLKSFNYSGDTIEDITFTFEKKVLGETLPEFNRLVDESSLSPEEKSEAKEVMGRDGDFVEKEQELQTKPYYSTLMSEVYPQMRYAKTSIKKPGAAKTLPEMSAMVKSMMESDSLSKDALTEQEYLYVASETPDLEERLAILGMAAENYQTWQVHNNIGATYMDMALLKNDMSNVDKAIEQFDASMGKKETGEAAYNLAMAYSMKGDMDKMEEYLQKAADLGGEGQMAQSLINGAKAYLAIKEAKARDDGKYKEAEDLLGNAPQSNPNLFNKGLAQLLQGVNYDAAIASFTSAAQKNPQDAMTQYGLAIAYARRGDESNMSSALKKACEMDSDLKAKALDDVEFDKYKGSSSFQDAIK